MLAIILYVFLSLIAILGVTWAILLRKSPSPISTANYVPKNDKLDFQKKIAADVVSDG